MAVEYSYASIRRSIAFGDVHLFRCGCLLGDGRPSCSRYGNHDGAMSGFFFLFVVVVVRPMRKFGALARCGSVGRRSAAGASLFRSAVRELRVLRRRPVLCSKRNGKNIPECRSAPKCTEAAAGEITECASVLSSERDARFGPVGTVGSGCSPPFPIACRPVAGLPVVSRSASLRALPCPRSRSPVCRRRCLFKLIE